MTDDAQPDTEMPPEPPREPAEGERSRVSPGHLLRSARERQGLSLDELTAQTLLTRNTVEALENNEFDRLSQPVFVRGYYRKCAKVLVLSEDEIMDAYAKWTGEPGPRPASPGQVDVVPQDVTPQRWRAFGLVLMVALIIAVGAVAWAWLPQLVNGIAGNPGTDEPSMNTGTTVPPATAPAASPDGEDGNGSTVADSPSETAEADTSVPVSPTRSTDEDAAGNGEPSSSANGGDEVVATTGDETLAATGEAVSGADGGSDASGVAARAKLVLRFQDKSWVRVRDAGGAVLLDGIVDGGNLRVVEGSPPYEVALGYAPGVEVSIGGRAVDTASQIGDNDTARFTVRSDGGFE